MINKSVILQAFLLLSVYCVKASQDNSHHTSFARLISEDNEYYDNMFFDDKILNEEKTLKAKNKIIHKKGMKKLATDRHKCDPKKQENKFVCIYTCNKFTKSSNLCKSTNVTIEGNKKLDCSNNQNYMSQESCCKDTEKQPYNSAKFVCLQKNCKAPDLDNVLTFSTRSCEEKLANPYG